MPELILKSTAKAKIHRCHMVRVKTVTPIIFCEQCHTSVIVLHTTVMSANDIKLLYMRYHFNYLQLTFQPKWTKKEIQREDVRWRLSSYFMQGW